MKKPIVIMTLVTLLAGCSSVPAEAPVDNTPEDGIQVVASFYPLAEFSRKVVGEYATVETVTPAGAEPHEYEPTPRQIGLARNADVFIYNGGGQDPWAEKIAEELQQQGKVVLKATEQIDLMKMEGGHEDEEDHEEEEGHDHEFDPHIWLDPNLAIQEVGFIRDALIQADPDNEGIYESNAGLYMNELMALDDQFREGLASCAKKDIITAHAAFGYMAKRYNFNQIPIAGMSTEEEPSARRLAELADIAKEKGINYIFFEELVSPRLSETLANEVGAQTLVLNPIEGLTKEQIEAGENYVTLMQTNLANLRIALECQ